MGPVLERASETCQAHKAIAKFRTLRLQSCFIHIFLKWTEVPFIQEVSGVYTSPFLDTAELKMALRARKDSWAFMKQAPGPGRNSILIEKKRLFQHWRASIGEEPKDNPTQKAHVYNFYL